MGLSFPPPGSRAGTCVSFMDSSQAFQWGHQEPGVSAVPASQALRVAGRA